MCVMKNEVMTGMKDFDFDLAYGWAFWYCFLFYIVFALRCIRLFLFGEDRLSGFEHDENERREGGSCCFELTALGSS